MRVYNCSISRQVLICFLPIWILLYLPHIIFYLTGDRAVIDDELSFLADSYSIRTKNRFIRFLWGIKYNPYFLALFYYRIGQTRAFICSFIKKDTAAIEFNCDRLGSTRMYHPFATVINAESIGDNFTFRNNTTIGNKSEMQPWDRPIIGDNVTVGANVAIFGRIRIGDNVTIGAGAVVNKDIPSNCIVIGNPCRIIPK